MTPPTSTMLRKALEQLRRELMKHESVLSIGVGFKHRRRGGFSPIEPCVSVLVRRKTKSPSPQEAVPPSVLISHAGKHRRILTDVSSILTGELQAKTFELTDGSSSGTLGFFAAVDQQLYAFSAGHVTAPDLDAGPREGSRVRIGGVLHGRVLANASWFRPIEGRDGVLDIGVAGLQRARAAVRRLVELGPWNTMRDRVSWRDVLGFCTAPERPPLTLHSHRGEVKAKFSRAYFNDLPVRLVDGVREFAPTLIEYTANRPNHWFQRGDSGAPLFDDQQRLVAIHIIGRNGTDRKREGIGVLVDTLLPAVAKRLGVPELQVLPQL